MAGGARRWSGRQKGKPARQRNSSLLVSARQLQAHVRQQPPLFAIVKGTIASKNLVVAYRAFLHIAADDMQLPFEHTAVVARLGFGSPVVSFGAVGDSGNLAAAARVGPNLLGLLNAIRPTCDHSDAAVLDEVLGHGRVVTLLPNGSRLSCGRPPRQRNGWWTKSGARQGTTQRLPLERKRPTASSAC